MWRLGEGVLGTVNRQAPLWFALVALCLFPTGVAADAPSGTSDAQVAHDVTEIPAAWTVLAFRHRCLANPWASGCSHPPTQITFPPALQLNAQVAAMRGGGADPTILAPVSDPQGVSITVGVRPTSRDAQPARVGSRPRRKAKASQAVLSCQMHVGYPEIVKFGSNYLARGISDLNCPAGVLEGTITDDLYRSGVPLAFDYDQDFSSPFFILASAVYDCHHVNAYPYTNVGLSYAEAYSGQAAANSGTLRKNHTCPT